MNIRDDVAQTVGEEKADEVMELINLSAICIAAPPEEIWYRLKGVINGVRN